MYSFVGAFRRKSCPWMLEAKNYNIFYIFQVKSVVNLFIHTYLTLMLTLTEANHGIEPRELRFKKRKTRWLDRWPATQAHATLFRKFTTRIRISCNICTRIQKKIRTRLKSL